MRRAAAACAVVLLAAGGPAGAEIPRAAIVLESYRPTVPGQVPAAAPPRFVLLEDGTVFVGGTRELWTGRLAGGEVKALERRVEAMRRITPLAGAVTLGAGAVTLGAGAESRRLVLRKGRPVDVTIQGGLDGVSPAHQLLAELIRHLEEFHHPSLRPYVPGSYAVSAREGALPGGCRSWRREEKLADAVFAPLVLSAANVEGWPTGANPAHICVDEKSYVVTFRPLLPGERP